MTVPTDSVEAKSDATGEIEDRLTSYLEAVEAEQETVEEILDDLDDLPDDEALDQEERADVFPSAFPLEKFRNGEWDGGDDGE